jgi:hypothetical protein
MTGIIFSWFFLALHFINIVFQVELEPATGVKSDSFPCLEYGDSIESSTVAARFHIGCRLRLRLSHEIYIEHDIQLSKEQRSQTLGWFFSLTLIHSLTFVTKYIYLLTLYSFFHLILGKFTSQPLQTTSVLNYDEIKMNINH